MGPHSPSHLLPGEGVLTVEPPTGESQNNGTVPGAGNAPLTGLHAEAELGPWCDWRGRLLGRR